MPMLRARSAALTLPPKAGKPNHRTRFGVCDATSAGARLDAGRVVSAAALRGEAQLGFSLLSAFC